MSLNIPLQLTAGDTATWSDKVDDYAPSDGYGFVYILAGATTLTINGTPNPDDGYDFNLTTIQTSGLTVATYYWQAVASKTGIRNTIATGRIEILANFAVITAPFTAKTYAEQMLERVSAAYEGALTVESYKIGDREKQNQNLRDLHNQLLFWQNRVRLEKLARGEIKDPRYAPVRFSNP